MIIKKINSEYIKLEMSRINLNTQETKLSKVRVPLIFDFANAERHNGMSTPLSNHVYLVHMVESSRIVPMCIESLL